MGELREEIKNCFKLLKNRYGTVNQTGDSRVFVIPANEEEAVNQIIRVTKELNYAPISEDAIEEEISKVLTSEHYKFYATSLIEHITQRLKGGRE